MIVFRRNLPLNRLVAALQLVQTSWHQTKKKFERIEQQASTVVTSGPEREDETSPEYRERVSQSRAEGQSLLCMPLSAKGTRSGRQYVTANRWRLHALDQTLSNKRQTR